MYVYTEFENGSSDCHVMCTLFSYSGDKNKKKYGFLTNELDTRWRVSLKLAKTLIIIMTTLLALLGHRPCTFIQNSKMALAIATSCARP